MLIAPLASARDISHRTAELIRPPRRIRPSEAASRYLRNDKGAWDPSLTPEMIEPLDLLASREYTGIVFVGPARSGKTFGLILAGAAYITTCAPGDSLIVQMSQDSARDFSRMDLDRSIRHSPELLQRLSPRARDDNTFDKFFRSGIVLKIGWPAVTQLSSKTLRYVMITDYDRPENRDNVDGEGPLWDLGAKRTETYMSRGKMLAESSPGGEYTDPQWRASTPHEAPPALGILSLYNRGTRARLYWPCKHCGEYFEAQPGLGCFRLPAFEELEDMVLKRDLMGMADEYARVVCPACGGLHELSDRPAMKARCRWVHEGQKVGSDGIVTGERRRSQIASFWEGGVAAAYQRWDSVLLKYFQALRTYVQTRDENPLKTTTNTDLAAPYLPRAIANRRGVEQLIERAKGEEWTRQTVPQEARFLTAAVDVQGNRFCVLVIGWGEGLESWVVDRFAITSSKRAEGERFAALDPASYLEDWDVLSDQVIAREYPIEGAPDQKLSVLVTYCDSGGRAGVTEKAYDFWRKVRAQKLGKRFRLVKGSGLLNAPRVQEVWPDSRGRSDRKAKARGDVPVLMLNVNVLKDGITGDLAREEPGPGFVHLPAWLERDYFDELTVENRTAKGWVKPAGARNEAFDLHVYNRAACIALGAEKIVWQKPPPWARRIELAPAVEAKPEEKPTDTFMAPKRFTPPPRRGFVKGWR
jgi:phage terminase large subunit GpA-like protein